jgi:hypothetical protein
MNFNYGMYRQGDYLMIIAKGIDKNYIFGQVIGDNGFCKIPYYPLGGGRDIDEENSLNREVLEEIELDLSPYNNKIIKYDNLFRKREFIRDGIQYSGLCMELYILVAEDENLLSHLNKIQLDQNFIWFELDKVLQSCRSKDEKEDSPPIISIESWNNFCSQNQLDDFRIN